LTRLTPFVPGAVRSAIGLTSMAGGLEGAGLSARLKTKSLFGAPAGGEMMVTASIKQPGPASPLGYWPGFWMLGPGRWPGTGENAVFACPRLSLPTGWMTPPSW